MDTRDRLDERRLLRLLAGELAPEEAADLRRRVARDPGAARRFAALKTRWESLELPPPRPAPPGFAGRIAALAVAGGAERRAAEAATLGSAWARTVAGGALVVGLAAGASLATLAGGAGSAGSGGFSDGEPNPAAVARMGPSGDGRTGLDWAGTDAVPSSLAESYWSALTGDEGSSTEAPPGASQGGEEPP